MIQKKESYNPIRTFPQNLKRQPPGENKNDYLADVTAWGFKENNKNNFPQQLLQEVQDSPVGFACLEVWSEFIQGNGLEDRLSIQKANRNETVGELLEKIVADIAYLEGFCVHITYNAAGEKKYINYQPFEQTRLKIAPNGQVQEIKTNPFFGLPEYESKYNKTYYPYNPDPEFVKQEIKNHQILKSEGKVKHDYPGQMYWAAIERPLARIYPKPFYFSGINWFRVDSEIQKFHERNITNNFLLSHVLNIFGNPDEIVGEEDENGDGKTLDELVQEKLRTQGSGAKNGGGQLINYYQSEEERLVPEEFPTNANDQLFQTLQELTTSQIAIACNVPTVLVNIQQEGRLGNNQEMINSIKLMQARVKPKQNFLAKHLKNVFSGMIEGTQEDWKPKDTNLIDILPDWVVNSGVLTKPELRNYIEKNFNIELS